MIDIGTRMGILLSFFIASSGMFSILFSAFMVIAIREKKLIHYLHAAFFFVIGFCIICDPYYRPGTENLTPHLLYVNFPVALLVGPLFFLYMKSLFDNRFRLSRRHLLLLIPTIMTFIAFIPYYILPVETKLAMFPIEQQPSGYFRALGVIMEYVISPWNILCTILSAKNNLHLLGKHNKIFRLTFLFILAVAVVSSILGYGDTLDDVFTYKIAIAGILILVIILAGFSAKFPSFFIRIRMEASAAKYAQSKLTSLNVDALISRIEDMMEYEHLYQDPELNLAGLSEKLDVSPHQLSEIINSRFQKNFNSYINDFRIGSARKMLLHDKDSTILSIALACGFNSKSNFNRVFQISSGSTPTEFRKNHG